MQSLEDLLATDTVLDLDLEERLVQIRGPKLYERASRSRRMHQLAREA